MDFANSVPPRAVFPKMAARTVAIATALMSIIALMLFLTKVVGITSYPTPGLLNPTLRLTVLPSTQGPLFAGLLWTIISVYIAAVVARKPDDPADIRIRLGKTPDENPQPAPVRKLKEAICSGNLELVRRYATAETLGLQEEECFLSPMELADIYGNEAIIDFLADAYRGFLGNRRPLPINRFAIASPKGNSSNRPHLQKNRLRRA